MNNQYFNLDNFFIDLTTFVFPNQEVYLDFTQAPLNEITLGSCPIQEYLQEELWDDCISYGNGNTYTFELPYDLENLEKYSQLWKPKWQGFIKFLHNLASRNIEVVSIHVGNN